MVVGWHFFGYTSKACMVYIAAPILSLAGIALSDVKK
jgi:hypothetical protein